MKWIHLNFGDIGVKALFLKSYESLEKGGILVLEAQNWKSYKKKKNLTNELADNYANIKFRPNQFDEFLTKQVGFIRLDVVRRAIDDVISDKIEKDLKPLYVY